MLSFLLSRASQFLISLLGITVLTFGIIHLAPGDPTDLQTTMNPRISAQAKENLKKLYGLDRPLHIQYFDWLRRFLTFGLGHSFVDGEAVSDKILGRLPVTLMINMISLLLIIMVSFPIGILSATRQYSWFDKVTTLLVYVGFSIPSFWLALLLMLLFGVSLGWLPILGYQLLTVSHLSFLEISWPIWSTHGSTPGYDFHKREFHKRSRWGSLNRLRFQNQLLSGAVSGKIGWLFSAG